MRTCMASRSRSENTAMLVTPSSRRVRMTRTAISPRLATRTLSNMGALWLAHRLGRPPLRRARLDEPLPIDEARAGAPEGVVAVADRQTAGRGRLDRTWEAPIGSSLLVS